mmetsp:Transcript_7866/g.24119  ORF Transcript_7866/g.24119 Transcript_7866/m.24119 type:complete len:328 (-) Transcript_7866:1472-2455(-)
MSIHSIFQVCLGVMALARSWAEEELTMPRLPNAYRVRIEANIQNKGYTLVQQDIYDGVNDRVKLSSQGGEWEMIELAAVGVTIMWWGETCLARYAGDWTAFMVDESGQHVRKSNEFLGSTEADVYVGRSEARGITTERFVRNQTSPYIDYELVFEFAADDWLEAERDEGESATPVRATLSGVMHDDGHSFSHVYEFYDYDLDVSSSDFEVPWPFAFDDGPFIGECNASALASDPLAKAALKALPVQESNIVTKKTKTSQRGGLVAAVGLALFAVGLVAGFAASMLLWPRSKNRREKFIEMADSDSSLSYADSGAHLTTPESSGAATV